MLANFVSTQNAGTENNTTLTTTASTTGSGCGTVVTSSVIGGCVATEPGGCGGGSRIVVQQSSAATVAAGGGGGGARGCPSSIVVSHGGGREGDEEGSSYSSSDGIGTTSNKETPANDNIGTNPAEAKQSLSMPPFSMPGVLHFLQQEWGRYELDRAQWEIERSELKTRISFLIGERKSQENLKHDLVRRIKMLEYALKQERAKFQQLIDSQETHNKTATNLDEGEEDDEKQDGGAVGDGGLQFCTNAANSSVPFDIDAILPSAPPHHGDASATTTAVGNTKTATNAGGGAKTVVAGGGLGVVLPPSSTASDQAWAHARETLRHYLQEIGYTEHMLEARCNRVKQLLGVHHHNNQPQQQLQGAANGGGTNEGINNINDALLLLPPALPPPARDVRGQQQQHNAKQQQQQQSSLAPNNQSRQQQQQRHISVDTVHGIPPATFASANAVAEQHQQQQRHALLMDTVAADFGDAGDDERFADIKSGFEDDDDDIVQRLHWNTHFTLRSHYDCVRAMQFHPVEPMLITASEDGTVKLWDLNHSSVGAAAKNEGGGPAAKNAQSMTTGIVDIEPLYTFRGHRGPILALDLAPLGETCYTGGLDGTICCWTVPSTAELDIYHTFDPSVLQERLCGHTDAVWGLCFHAASNRLISASADGTIRIWIVGLADGAMPSPLLKTIHVSSTAADVELLSSTTPTIRPHSIDLVSTADRQQLLCAYQGNDGGDTRRCCCNIRDLETGQVVVNFQFGGDDQQQPNAVNKILSHPTMPVSIAAGEDRKIRFFDNNTGKLIGATMAHVEGVSTLAIDPNGLYMLSGSHDGSVRLWNAEKRVCLQEIAAHRKKLGAGVMAVAFHPSRQLIGSSGADSLAKVYSPVRQSPRSSVVAPFAGTSPYSSPGSSGPSSVVGSPQKSSPIASSSSSAATPATKQQMKI